MIIPLGLGAVSYAEIVRLCGARVYGKLPIEAPLRLVTDSREVIHGDLFCALKGFDDGHRYIKDAAARGAVAVLAEQATDAPLTHLLVPSVRRALAAYAIGVSESRSLTRIAITGSVGKTTTKDAIAAMLSPHFKVHATYGNFNNDLGLPFTILSAPKDTEIAVCEVGISHKGEMKELSRIVRPHISLITCIGHAHIGAFGTREAIAEEKLSLLSFAEENGSLLVPHGEPLLSLLPPHGIRRIAVSPFSAKDLTEYGLECAKGDVSRAFALGYAAAIGDRFSLSKNQIKEGLQTAQAIETHRHEETVEKICLIDDGYNASPESVLGALTYLGVRGKGGRVAVLGDMLELGENSARYHRAVGRFSVRHAERLFFIGAYAEEYACGAKAGGGVSDVDKGEGKSVFSILEGSREEIAASIAANLKEGDTVLFKASRALEIEKIVALVKKQILKRW